MKLILYVTIVVVVKLFGRFGRSGRGQNYGNAQTLASGISMGSMRSRVLSGISSNAGKKKSDDIDSTFSMHSELWCGFDSVMKTVRPLLTRKMTSLAVWLDLIGQLRWWMCWIWEPPTYGMTFAVQKMDRFFTHAFSEVAFPYSDKLIIRSKYTK